MIFSKYIMSNSFLHALHTHDTITENGALSHGSTGSAILAYFSKAGTYRDRKLEDVFADLSKMWAESPELTLRVIFYNRMITRASQGAFESEAVQAGQGNRSEFRRALVWLARFHGDSFRQNLWLVPVVGVWKDLWHAETVDALPADAVHGLIESRLHDNYDGALLAKYLPKMRSKANTFNDRHRALNGFAARLIKRLKWTPQEYRKFKSSGRSHVFQTQMMRGEWDEIAFAKLPGRALHQLVNHVGRDGETTLVRHGQEARYVDWIRSQPVAKFTGYVYELMKGVHAGMSLAQKLTLDRQFDGLIELAQRDRKVTGNVWTALDTSGSMTMPVANTTAFDICVSLGVYFATLNEGTFKDHVIMFDDKSKVQTIGGGFTDKVLQIKAASTAWGSTNFQSVIDEIVRVRQTRPAVPVADFPTTLIVVSDMQFNPVGGNAHTNYEAAMAKLAAVGLPKLQIVWWWVTGRAEDFPSTQADEGVVMIGGFDGAILSQLIGEEAVETSVKTDGASTAERKQATPYEAMVRALDQELLRALVVG